MKKLFLGFALGTLAGVFAFKKMEDEKLPEKIICAAQKKLEESAE